MKRAEISPLLCSLIALCLGCSSTVPYTGAGPHPQIERGTPNIVFDTLANIFSLPHKLLLANRNIGNAYVSPEVEQFLTEYVDAHQNTLTGRTKYRLNQYAPVDEFRRLFANDDVALPYRLLIGIPYTLISDVILTSRWIGAWNPDRYSPWTNTVHLHSNQVDVALHKSAHALDVSQRARKGTYGILFIPVIPFAKSYPEMVANRMTFEYLRELQYTDEELESYQVLMPSWSSNFGKTFSYPGWIIGAIVGHIAGFFKRTARERELDRQS